MSVLRVDLGGTRLKAAMPGGVEVVEHEGAWLSAVRSVLAASGADELALCVPGLVDAGRVVALPGKLPGLEQADLEALLGVRVVLLVNDALAYGVGEAVAGAGRGATRAVVVTVGTGLGVAVVEDGRPLGRGPLGGGLLGGQLPLGGGGSDTSGRSGTFEALCRADALTASVPGAGGVEEAYAMLRAGDPAAAQGFSSYRADLVRGLTALALAHAPDVLVVGGGAAQPELLDGVQDAVREGLWPGQSVDVRLGELGDTAALHGLAALLSDLVAS